MTLLAAEHTAPEPFSPLRRPPTTDAPWPPPTRFVRRTHAGHTPLAPRITLHCDDVPDDAELQFRIDELKKFTAIWQQEGSAAEEEDTHSNKKFNAHQSQKKRARRPS